MTDDIELSESVEAFDPDGFIRASLSREDELGIAIQEKTNIIMQMEKQLEDFGFIREDIETELELWKGLEKKKSKGQQVYPPRASAKRKRPAAVSSRRRLRQVVQDDSDFDDTNQMPLTIEDISSKLSRVALPGRAAGLPF